MSFQEEIETIFREVPGCHAAVLMNLEGMVVARHVEPGSDLDVEILLVELTNSMKQARQAIANIAGGDLKEFAVGFDRGTLVVRFLRDDHFVALLVDPRAVLGKGRHVLRWHCLSLMKELS